jgi:hypothetical protein
MVKEIGLPLRDDCREKFPIYNFGATADDRKILHDSETTINNEQKLDLAALFDKRGIRYYRTISSDKDLAVVLAQELIRRGVDLCPEQISRDGIPSAGAHCDHPHHDRVFLLSEWDTEYGRDLPESVSATFGADNSSFGGCRLNPSHGVMHASYMRGLDGRLPNRRAANPAKPADRESGEQAIGEEPSATPDTTGRFEAAEGQSQFDYLRRLTKALKECDERLRFAAKGKIAAIGILGSDVYDKLLLLQALRPEFPEVTFFTTDLDELLLPQEKLRYTRNLLVASGYGLTLIPELQRDVPPFRSNYQTSIFLATLLAIRNKDLIDPKTEPWGDATAALSCWSYHPLLFQIGRTAPRALPSGPVAGADKACQPENREGSFPAIVKYTPIQPEVASLYPEFAAGARFGLFVLPIALLVIVSTFPGVRRVCFARKAPTDSNPPLSEPEVAPTKLEVPATEASGQTKQPPRPLVQPGVGWVVPLLAAALLAWALVTLGWQIMAPWLTQYGNGEPMALFEGISIWPTIALRLFGIVLALLLVWYTLRAVDLNMYETGDAMGFSIRSPTLANACKEVWEKLHEVSQKGIRGSEKHKQLSEGLGTQPRWRELILSLLWFPPQSTYTKPEYDAMGRRKVRFEEIFFGPANKWCIRCLRAAVGTGIMALVAMLILVPVFGKPYVPVRGDRARDMYWWVTVFDGLSTLFLTFLVTDATLYSRAFIVRLTRISTVWPDNTVKKFEQRFGLSDDALADWIDMQYLAKRTECITQLIYFPFLSLALIIISANHLFDDFWLPWTVPAARAIALAVVIGSVLAYRSAAEAARRAAREHLTAKIIAAQGNRKRASQLALMLSEIESLRDGAFAPLASQPIVKAVLLPLVTYGGTWLAHLYGLPGT